MKIILLCCFSLVCISSFAQTKKIAFKSHSGSAENFSIALENNLFDMENSNFGNPVYKELDSVILIADSVAVLVSHLDTDPITNPRKKDTLRSRSLFSRKTPLDSVKKGLKREFWFHSSVDSIKFIGFETTPPEKKKNNAAPVMGVNNNGNQGPFDGQAFLIIGLIVFLSLAAGLLTWKYKPVQLS